MKLQIYRECGPRSRYFTFFDVKTPQDAFDLVTALANSGLTVTLTEDAYEEAPGEVVGGRGTVAKTVADAIRLLKPKGR